MKTRLCERTVGEGRRRRLRRPHGAFTLIELMVVVAIMMLVLMMGLPAIRGALHREAMGQAIWDVTEACAKARARAILTGTTSELRIYPKSGRIEVGDAPVDVTAGAAPAAKPTGVKGAPGFSGQLSDRLIIDMCDVNFIEYKGAEEAHVRFHPNGTSDDFTLIFHSDAGEYRKISLEVVTALAQVGPVQPGME